VCVRLCVCVQFVCESLCVCTCVCVCACVCVCVCFLVQVCVHAAPALLCVLQGVRRWLRLGNEGQLWAHSAGRGERAADRLRQRTPAISRNPPARPTLLPPLVQTPLLNAPVTHPVPMRVKTHILKRTRTPSHTHTHACTCTCTRHKTLTHDYTNAHTHPPKHTHSHTRTHNTSTLPSPGRRPGLCCALPGCALQPAPVPRTQGAGGRGAGPAGRARGEKLTGKMRGWGGPWILVMRERCTGLGQGGKGKGETGWKGRR
jgi:hypothetical protein